MSETSGQFSLVMPTCYDDIGKCPTCGAPLFMDGNAPRDEYDRLLAVPTIYYSCSCRYNGPQFNTFTFPQYNPLGTPVTPTHWPQSPFTVSSPNQSSCPSSTTTPSSSLDSNK